ncbi:hypothetical protein GNP79_12710 [Aliivibrio fischeri]|uniref:Uncharacterized protein n=2 Tax=Aliivibrio fischeri TaxID=668 RepID=A0A1B9PER0_ALIFS|nr:MULTISPECIES: hypothetical protein [Aliivibrio]ACH64469.1 conserved hypothetical protein [Aliivibrio fischeri MJ11]MBD1570822.1 hypothetical protein [Aliivibrio sp. S10_S31]MCE4936181.1 hypothetical protein [Aliivibrio fischeri]MUK45805.1 hypothetical protein [Aliivibrio fischeri]MUK81654.1 hypothetical protein [Aliivibrio fischeri]
MKVDYIYLTNKILDSCEILRFAIEKDNELYKNNKETIIKLISLNDWLISELSNSTLKYEQRELMLKNCLTLSEILKKLD